MPGRYRVYVQKESRGVGRTHEVEVTAGATRRLVVSWGLDAALRTTPFVGFAFASEAQRRKSEAPLATAVARAIGASSVVVVGVRPFEGRRALVGTVLSPGTAKPLRSAALALEPVEPGDDKIRGLARFLAGLDVYPLWFHTSRTGRLRMATNEELRVLLAAAVGVAEHVSRHRDELAAPDVPARTAEYRVDTATAPLRA